MMPQARKLGLAENRIQDGIPSTNEKTAYFYAVSF
jgi:hypothetical protein